MGMKSSLLHHFAVQFHEFDFSSIIPYRAMLPAQHFRSSGLPCRWSDGLEFATGQSPWPSAQQQQLQTIAEEEFILSLPLGTNSAVEMLYDSTVYKSIIDVDI